MAADDLSKDLPLSLFSRLWFAWVCFFQVLFNRTFAERAFRATHGLPPGPSASPALPVVPAPVAEGERVGAGPDKGAKTEEGGTEPSSEPALQLLALLQREGRFIDFVEQNIDHYSDADIGATARVVHGGCRKALRSHVQIAPIRTEEEGAALTLAPGFSPVEVKLVGNVRGNPPYRGVLLHRGWRVVSLQLPKGVSGHDAFVVAPAEVEL